MGKHCLLFIFLLLLFSCASAQEINVNFDIEPGIEKVEEAHLAAWQKVGKIEGYRIQIIAVAGTNSKKSAQTIVDEFSLNFPEIPVYLSYSEPNFRVRVGDFKTRLDAFNALSGIKLIYSGAFIVKDKILYSGF